ncbi:MAG TPA: hypothetical protein VIP77_16870 [Jiangellaceae bacterium]
MRPRWWSTVATASPGPWRPARWRAGAYSVVDADEHDVLDLGDEAVPDLLDRS